MFAGALFNSRPLQRTQQPLNQEQLAVGSVGGDNLLSTAQPSLLGLGRN